MSKKPTFSKKPLGGAVIHVKDDSDSEENCSKKLSMLENIHRRLWGYDLEPLANVRDWLESGGAFEDGTYNSLRRDFLDAQKQLEESRALNTHLVKVGLENTLLKEKEFLRNHSHKHCDSMRCNPDCCQCGECHKRFDYEFE